MSFKLAGIWREKEQIFFALEKINYNKRNLNRLCLSNGTVTTQADEILNENKRFYQNLYTARRACDRSDTWADLLDDVELPIINGS